LDERTPESYKNSQQTKEINRLIQEAKHGWREARVAEHKANKPKQAKYVEFQTLPNYTGINDATGEPIYVGDTVERVLDMRNAYSAGENRDKGQFPDFDVMSEPFEVKRDCYLYGHWIAKSVAEGDNFGVDTFCFSKELLKVKGKAYKGK